MVTPNSQLVQSTGLYPGAIQIRGHLNFSLSLCPPVGSLQLSRGLLKDIVMDLNVQQPLRRVQDENAYTKIQEIIDGLKAIIADDEEERKGQA
jgi:hypothetical protein